MRILEIREKTIPLGSYLRNAVVSFNDHTVSLVALLSDQIRGGKPVIGFAFNSIGRFGQAGIINERLSERVINADELLDQEGHLSPALVATAAMKNEKPETLLREPAGSPVNPLSLVAPVLGLSQ